MSKADIRPILIEGQLAYVPLTRGYVAVIDAADAPLVDRGKWRSLISRRRDGTIRTVYAVRTESGANGKAVMLYMHRLIADTQDGMDTDHSDGNGLNNRRDNLREATHAQNMHNMSKMPTNTSGAKGVSWDKARMKWQAKFKVNGKMYHCGRFDTIDDASEAYAKACLELHGEFARTS